MPSEVTGFKIFTNFQRFGKIIYKRLKHKIEVNMYKVILGRFIRILKCKLYIKNQQS